MAFDLFSKAQVLQAIDGSFGIVSQIARNLGGCAWHTANKYMNRWAETRLAYADENERALDVSESQLLKACESGDGPMIRFHLSTKGKDRGYVERVEQEQVGEVILRVKRENPRTDRPDEDATSPPTVGQDEHSQAEDSQGG